MGVVGCTTHMENYPTPNPREVNVTTINFKTVGYMILSILWPTYYGYLITFALTPIIVMDIGHYLGVN